MIPQLEAEERGRDASRRFRCYIVSYGSYVSLSIQISDNFHGRTPYGFRLIHRLTPMD